MDNRVFRVKSAADKVRFAAEVTQQAGTSTESIGLVQIGVSGNQHKELPNNVVYDTYYKLYELSAPLSFAIGTKAGQFASLPMGITEKRNGSDARPVYNHKCLDLLNWVNPEMTTYDFLEALSCYFDLTGMWAFAIEETPKAYRDRYPASLYPLNPAWLSPVTGPDGLLFWSYAAPKDVLASTGTRDSEGSVTYYPSQIVTNISFSPKMSRRGSSKLKALQQDISAATQARIQQQNYYSSFANLGGVIYTNLGKDDTQLIRDQVSQIGGAENSYKMLVLAEDMRFEQMKGSGDTLNEGVRADIREVDKQIMQMMGVPIGLYTGETSGKAVELLSQMFFITILPFVNKFTQRMTKDLLGRYYNEPKMSISMSYMDVPAMRLYDLDKARVIVAKVLAGAMTVDEARAYDGSPALKMAINEELKKLLGPTLSYAIENYGTLTRPILNILAAQQTAADGTSATPSLDLTGTSGGRNQSSDGEAQMLDGTGTKTTPKPNYVPMHLDDEICYKRIQDLLGKD